MSSDNRNMQRIAYWSGAFIPAEDVHISLDDRGYAFGDGVYEVVMGFRGKPFGLDAHLDRWAHSLREARLHAPYLHDELGGIIREAIARVDAPQVLVYFQLTRGAFPRRHAFPPEGTPPCFLLTAQPYEDDPLGLQGGFKASLFPDVRWHRCDIKSLNLLPNVMATQAALDQGAQVPVFLRDGIVTECASANLFIVQDGTLVTHPLDQNILAGTTRADVIKLAAGLGIPCVERRFGVDTLHSASEVFCTSVGTRPAGIISVDGQPVGEGQIGEITRAIRAAYQALEYQQCP